MQAASIALNSSNGRFIVNGVHVDTMAVISPLLILCVVAYLNWLCAVLLLISAPLIPLFVILVGMGAEQLNQKYSTIRQRLAGHFIDRVANLSTIKMLGAAKQFLKRLVSIAIITVRWK
jgi:ABC-type transport system involved in cytochrome bd biosynthesis fused ATPase/permease subunit